MFHCRSWIEFHHAREIRDRFRARQRQDHAYKLHPDRPQTLVPRLEKMRGEMRRAHRDQNHHYQCGRQRQRHSETSGMLRPEIIDHTHQQKHGNRCERYVIAKKPDPSNMLRAGSDVAQCRPATERSRHRKIRNQQQRPDHRQQAALLARGGVNTAAIREMTADNDVIDADQPGERANGQDDRQRRKSRRRQTQAQ